MIFLLKILSTFLAVLSLSLTVNCSEEWCPCLQPINILIQNTTKQEVTPHVCEKYKGILFSEKREFKCECCLILRAFKESCKPAKNPKFVVKCEEGLNCDRKYVCRGKLTRCASLQPKYDMSRSIDQRFAGMNRNMLICDCSTSQCDNELTRNECEEHQGWFADKLSARKSCQCCDRCIIPRGQHQLCGSNLIKNVDLVCDTGLYCSPFIHMCIEKSEIFSQFQEKLKKENSSKKERVFKEESLPYQSVFIKVNRKKRDVEEGGESGEPSSAEGVGEAQTTTEEEKTTTEEEQTTTEEEKTTTEEEKTTTEEEQTTTEEEQTTTEEEKTTTEEEQTTTEEEQTTTEEEKTTTEEEQTTTEEEQTTTEEEKTTTEEEQTTTEEEKTTTEEEQTTTEEEKTTTEE